MRKPETFGDIELPIYRIFGGQPAIPRYRYPDGVQCLRFRREKLSLPPLLEDRATELLERARRQAEARHAVFVQRDMIRLDDCTCELTDDDRPWPLILYVSLTDYYTDRITHGALDETLSDGRSAREVYAVDPADIAGSKLANPLATDLSLVTRDRRTIYVARRGPKVGSNPGGWAPAISGTGNAEDCPGERYNPFLTARREATEEATKPHEPDVSRFTFFGLARRTDDFHPFLFGELHVDLSHEELRSQSPPDNWDAELVPLDFTPDAVVAWVIRTYRDVTEGRSPRGGVYTAIYCVLQSLQYQFADEWPQVLSALRWRPGVRIPRRQVDNPVFTSHQVLVYYPAPIALAYQRIFREPEYSARLGMLTQALEATLRYLLAIGLSDLFRSLAEKREDPDTTLQHPAFEFLRTETNMTLGRWAEALRETAKLLAGRDDTFIGELPEVCKPGGVVDELVSAYIRDRNREWVHLEGSHALGSEEARAWLPRARARLEDILRRIAFVCSYPLGFARRTPSAKSSQRLRLWSCVGTEVREVGVLECPVALEDGLPFLITSDESHALYLWPWLRQQPSSQTDRPTLYGFERILGDAGRYLTRVRSVALDIRGQEPWDDPPLHPQRVDGHAWLIQRLRGQPATVPLPTDLRAGSRLLPVSHGRWIGRMVGAYQLRAVIGRGTFGTVYAAETDLGDFVAVKVIDHPESYRLAIRFEQEVAKLRQARECPNIVRILGADSILVDAREYLWYAMEYALGGDLTGRIARRSRLAGERTPWEDSVLRRELLDEFMQVVNAVTHLHSLDIIHRDLKPANVLVRESGELCLCDFGLVKDLRASDAQTSTGAALGTRPYAAPEQESGTGEVTKAADVYALGVLLAELASGRMPMTNPLTRGGKSTLTNFLAKFRWMPRSLRRLLSQCSQAESSRRLADAQELKSILAKQQREWLDG